LVKAKSAETSTHAEISKAKKSDLRIDIPEESKTTKAIYRERPSLEIVLDIKRHIRETRRPWTDPRHTHTRPPKGANVVYLGEFDLPTGHLTPCPCCSISTLKFGHGMIGWFPDEAVIRNIGPQCFRTLNEEGHKSALEAYDLEKKATQDRDYLLERKDLVQDLITSADEILEVARAADAFFPALSDIFHRDLRIPLYKNVRDGQMKVIKSVKIIRRDRDGNTVERKTMELKPYATLDGYSAMKPDRNDLLFNVLQARSHLVQTSAFTREDIMGAPDEQRTAVAKKMRRAINSIRQVRDVLDKELSFLRAENVQRIKHWARRQDAQLRFDFSASRGVVTVAKDGDTRTILIPEALRRRQAPKFEDI